MKSIQTMIEILSEFRMKGISLERLDERARAAGLLPAGSPDLIGELALYIVNELTDRENVWFKSAALLAYGLIMMIGGACLALWVGA